MIAQRAVIVPVPPDEVRPRWSVMIPAYERATLLRETLQSVLAQDPGQEAMQIEVVDDGSREDLKAIVDDVGKGRVQYYRQPHNVGLIANFATCLNRSRGEIVHLLHGDDLVLPGFYSAVERGFEDPAIGAAFCRWQVIDADGTVTAVAEPEQDSAGPMEDAIGRLASEQRIVTPSIAVRRSVWEDLGGFDPRLECAEDWEMWVRIAARYGVWYEPAVLASYRSHAQSNSGRHFANARELHYTQQAMELFRPLLPKDRARAIIGAARRAYARTALDNARQLARDGRKSPMWAHLRMAARFWPGLTTLRDAARIASSRMGR
jgi:glycosyltransferase involved in cell wall biosynthesis